MTDLGHSFANHGLNYLGLFLAYLQAVNPRDDLLTHPLPDPVAISLSLPSPLIDQQADAPEGIISGGTLGIVGFDDLVLQILPRELLE